MANIRIERRRAAIWPFVIGLLLLIGVIWAVTRLRGENNERPAQVQPAR